MNDKMDAERRARMRSALVRAGREERASSARRAKVLALGAGIAVGATIATTSTAAAATAASATATSSVPVSAAVAGSSFAAWKMVVVAAGLLAASGGAAVVVAANERSAPPPRVETSRMVSPPSSAAPTTTSSPSRVAAEVPTMAVGDLPSAKKDATRVARPVETSPAAPAPAPSLADEMRSAEAIRSATREGRSDDAMRLLDEHDARFPHGALTEEVEVLRIESLARAGRGAEAKRLADRFVRERPNSPYAPRVRSTMSRLE